MSRQPRIVSTLHLLWYGRFGYLNSGIHCLGRANVPISATWFSSSSCSAGCVHDAPLLHPTKKKQCDSWSVAAAEYHHSWDHEFNALFQVRYGCCSVHILTWCCGLSFLAVQNLIIRSSSKLVKTHLLAHGSIDSPWQSISGLGSLGICLSSQLRVRGTSSGGDLPWGFGAETPWTCAKSQR